MVRLIYIFYSCTCHFVCCHEVARPCTAHSRPKWCTLSTWGPLENLLLWSNHILGANVFKIFILGGIWVVIQFNICFMVSQEQNCVFFLIKYPWNTSIKEHFEYGYARLYVFLCLPTIVFNYSLNRKLENTKLHKSANEIGRNKCQYTILTL